MESLIRYGWGLLLLGGLIGCKSRSVPPEPAGLSMEFHGVNYANEVRDSLRRHPETTVFICTDCGLEAVPAELLACGGLRELALTHNDLQGLPADLSGWPQLQRIDLSYNGRLGFPVPICQLPALREVTLYGCGIAALPPETAQLKALQTLHLGQNPIAPTGLQPLSHLPDFRILDLSYANLYTVPEELTRLTSLQQLNLSANGIQELPPFLFDLPLVSLDLSENKLSRLSPAFHQFTPTLSYLGLGANPLDATAVDRLRLQMPGTEISFWQD